MLLLNKDSVILQGNIVQGGATEVALSEIMGSKVIAVNCQNKDSIKQVMVGSDAVIVGKVASIGTTFIVKIQFEEGGYVEGSALGKIYVKGTDSKIDTRELQSLNVGDSVLGIYAVEGKYSSDASRPNSTTYGALTVMSVETSVLEPSDLRFIKTTSQKNNILVKARTNEWEFLGNIFVILGVPHTATGGVSWEKLQDF